VSSSKLVRAANNVHKQNNKDRGNREMLTSPQLLLQPDTLFTLDTQLRHTLGGDKRSHQTSLSHHVPSPTQVKKHATTCTKRHS
jgi:hypothetical protein